MTRPEQPDPEDAPIPEENAAEDIEEYTYEFPGGSVTSVSGPMDEDDLDTARGLAHALSFAPIAEACIAKGRIEEAIHLFQEATGISRTEAEEAVHRLQADLNRARAARLRWIGGLSLAVLVVVAWFLFR